MRITNCLIAIAIALTVAGAIACGPELTEPANADISGAWFANGPAAGLTDVTLNLTQAANGALTGTFTATGTPGTQFCPPTGPCLISGTISGSNTVLQVYFELEHAGEFTGQMISVDNLRGAMSRTAHIGPIDFVRLVDPAL